MARRTRWALALLALAQGFVFVQIRFGDGGDGPARSRCSPVERRTAIPAPLPPVAGRRSEAGEVGKGGGPARPEIPVLPPGCVVGGGDPAAPLPGALGPDPGRAFGPDRLSEAAEASWLDRLQWASTGEEGLQILAALRGEWLAPSASHRLAEWVRCATGAREVRAAALAVLGSGGSESAGRELLGLLEAFALRDDSDGLVRTLQALAGHAPAEADLDRVGSLVAIAADPEVRREGVRLLRVGSGADRWAWAAADPETAVRREAHGIGSSAGSPAGGRGFRGPARDPDPVLRAEWIGQLAGTADLPEVRDACGRFLREDGSELVRHAAVLALSACARRGDLAARDALAVAAAADPSALVRDAAQGTLEAGETSR